MAECGKGWTGRCSAAKGKKCRCKCGGTNHGASREPEKGASPDTAAEELLVPIMAGFMLGAGQSVKMDPWFNYPGLHGRQGACHLTVLGKVVIATERQDNPGASITNCAEALSAKLRETYGEDIIVVEHYRDRGYGIGESLSIVNIVDGHAKWTHINREDLKIMVRTQKPTVRNAIDPSRKSPGAMSDDELLSELRS